MTRSAEQPEYSSATTKGRAKRIWGHENTILGVALAAVIAILGGISRGATVAPSNVANILLQSAIRGVVAVGQAFVILTGNIDLSVSGVGVMTMMLGGAMMTTEWRNIVGHPVAPPLAILVMLIAGIGWGLLSGTLVSRVKIPSLIATFGVWKIAEGVAYYITEGTALTELPRSLEIYGSWPTAPITFFLVAAAAYMVLSYTTIGRNVFAVGGNPMSAFLSGINVNRMHLFVFAISGLLAALGGVMMVSRGMAASMEALRGLELDSIAAVAIGGVSLFGGRGNIIGVVLGSMMIGVINNAMSVMHMGHAGRYIVKGSIIIGAVAADIIRRRRS